MLLRARLRVYKVFPLLGVLREVINLRSFYDLSIRFCYPPSHYFDRNLCVQRWSGSVLYMRLHNAIQTLWKIRRFPEGRNIRGLALRSKRLHLYTVYFYVHLFYRHTMGYRTIVTSLSYNSALQDILIMS